MERQGTVTLGSWKTASVVAVSALYACIHTYQGEWGESKREGQGREEQ